MEESFQRPHGILGARSEATLLLGITHRESVLEKDEPVLDEEAL
jgi:hypothetical protein